MKAWIEAALAPSAEPWALPIAAALLAVFVLAGARLLLRRPPRWPARLGLQALALLLLWRLLCPPLLALAEPGRIDVLGAGWQAALAASPDARMNPAAAVRALPEAQPPLPAGVERMPDLASVLRQHPGARLRLIGEGLNARDQDAARGRLAQWLPAPLPPGLIELSAPARVALGAAIEVRGVWRGAAPLRVELHDAAGAVLAAHAFDRHSQASQDGAEHAQDERVASGPTTQSFTLTVPARAAGALSLDLVAIEADDSPRRLLRLPLQVEAAPGLAIGLLAGAPGAELRALRRWAVDAGHRLDSRIVLSRGRVMGASPSFGVEELAALDLLIVDERAWAALGEAGRAQVQSAVEAGLGLLLRPLALPPRSQWPLYAQQGFAIETQAAAELQLAGIETRLAALPMRAQAQDALPVLQDLQGSALGLWRPRGLGRVAMLWLGATQGLVGRGEEAAHARLWADIARLLARAVAPGEASLRPGLPAPQPAPVDAPVAFAHERVVLCGLGAQATAWPEFEEDGDASATDNGPAEHEPLANELAATEPAVTGLVFDARGCAALWPRQPGRHRIRSGTGSSAAEQSLQVIDPAALPALHAARREAATRALLATPLRASGSGSNAPASAWPWLPPLLLVLALLWWLERRSRDL